MSTSPLFLSFVLALVNIYFLANIKFSLLVKMFAAVPLAVIVGFLGAIAYTPNNLQLSVLIKVGLLNLILTVGLYPFLASKFFREKKSQSEINDKKAWLEKNFKKKK